MPLIAKTRHLDRLPSARTDLLRGVVPESDRLRRERRELIPVNMLCLNINYGIMRLHICKRATRLLGATT